MAILPFHISLKLFESKLGKGAVSLHRHIGLDLFIVESA